ncbi:hypothetical protein [Lachnoanaerobaculum sp. Marseille-Q4761]|jgi:hypothetical protein|uniref:hypothetical protein n=1 Tax=Lachnoanaerobaculum sp. Marseille-Q4761 TaxID=2819511 RepID=UPI001FB83651|nr:hypothetical protein [Lachnoanaerobaculum sp. Marseille-Q4761]
MQYDKTFKEKAVRLSDEIGLKMLQHNLVFLITPYPDGVTNAINTDRMLFPEVVINLFREILKSNAS